MMPAFNLYRKMVKKPHQEIQLHMMQMQSRYHALSMVLYRLHRYKEASIAWGKYRAYVEMQYGLFPMEDDQGKYTFNYLFSKLDVQLSEIETELEEQYAKARNKNTDAQPASSTG